MKIIRVNKVGSSFIGRFSKDYAILFATIVMAIIFSLISPYFFKFDNLRNILLQSATVSIVTIGQALILLSGNFDLSLGQITCVTGCLAAYMMKMLSLNPIIAIFTALFVGIIFGLINGLLVAYVGIPAFIATLGIANISKGIAKIITNAATITPLSPDIAFLGKGYIFKIPFPVILMLILYIIAVIVMGQTKLGRSIYAVGGNKEAAFFSGINVKKNTMIPFVVAGFLSAFAGIILISRLNSASITNGNGYEFDAVIASMVGGISLFGGKGKIITAMFGTIFVVMFFNGMTMLNVDPFYQDVIKGIVLILALTQDAIRNKLGRR